MKLTTINRTTAIHLFNDLLTNSDLFQILHLVGEPRSGKSHLITKLFPLMLRNMNICKFATIVSSKGQSDGFSIVNILNTFYHSLGSEGLFPRYKKIADEWNNPSRVSINKSSSWFSWITIKSQESTENYSKKCQSLTFSFLEDISDLQENIILLIDIQEITDTLSDWIFNILIPNIIKNPYIKIVVSENIPSKINKSYNMQTRSYTLSPVHDHDEYIHYCKEMGVELLEQSIKDIAHISDYKPGLFAEAVSKFL